MNTARARSRAGRSASAARSHAGRGASAARSRASAASRAAGRAPRIGDYGLIGGGQTVALVSNRGSIDWCCLPRVDSGSCFARLLDPERGGHCSVEPAGESESASAYEEDTLVLVTTFHAAGGRVRVTDFFAMSRSARREPGGPQILRCIEGERGGIELDIEIAPRFDYGALAPWIRQEAEDVYSAIGGDNALVIWSDAPIAPEDDHALRAHIKVRGGERLHVCLTHTRPELLDEQSPHALDDTVVHRRLQETRRFWRSWARQARYDAPDAPAVRRSALTLKALTHARTGAIAAAATTSLPEAPRGKRNWDYRYSWLRDSTFSVRALAALGYEEEASRFRGFILRSSAGHADEMQVVYGVGGERRLPELEIPDLRGYRGARPVRVGNGATEQHQADAYGEVLNLTWEWFQRGHSPSDDDWRFLVALVERAAERWSEPDRGIWEWRGRSLHFVHSKAACWAAVDRGLRLAEATQRRGPIQRWRRARTQIRRAIERRGYDRRRGVFVGTFGGRQADAALLLLPVTGFVAWDDERMLRTTDVVAQELDEGGLLRRYRRRDGLPGREGVFLACSFWLAECYARQRRLAQAREVFERAVSTANALGLFSEQYDVRRHEMLGNFPQALTHFSHIAAAHAIQTAESDGRSPS